MRIKILGAGAWGTALYSVVRQNDPTVTILKRGDKIDDFDVLIMSIPTQSIRECLEKTSFTRENKIIINTAKGIERSTYFLPYQIVQSVVGRDIEYFTLIGPSFAQEVGKRMPTLVNLGSINGRTDAIKIRDLIQTSYFRVRITRDVEALELSAAFKNMYAIICGVATGLGYAVNTRTKLMILAIEELNRLYQKRGLVLDPDSTIGTVGDLILTCSGSESRNFTFGKLLATHSVDESLQIINQTVEGYNSLASVNHFRDQSGAEMPLVTLIGDIVQLKDPYKIKAEFEKFVSTI